MQIFTLDAVREQQRESLGILLNALVPDNQFFASRLREAGLDSGEVTLEQFISKMPFTMREDWTRDQLETPPYGTNLTFALPVYSRISRSSGTSGTPMIWLDTPRSWNEMLNNWSCVYESAGINDATRIFFAFSFGPFLGFWTAFEAGTRLGCMCIPGGAMTSLARLELMTQTQADVLCCTPTYAMHLSEVARKHGLDTERLAIEKIIVAGEPGGSIPSTRALMSKQWNGAQVFDHHGMTEVGPVSYPCPAVPGNLHVMETSYLAEVVDPVTGAIGAEGDRGELVLTTLRRIGSPLLRYRTGDIVRTRRQAPCDCGSQELLLEGGIQGRTDDMITVRGVNVWPSAIEEIARGIRGIEEYQVDIGSDQALQEIRIRVEPCPSSDGARICREFQSRLREALSLRVQMDEVPPETLPRFEFKAKRWNRNEGRE